MRKYVGVDYHRKRSYMVVMNEKGKLMKQGEVENRKEEVAKFLYRAGCNGNSAAVLEATRNWVVMHDWLEGMVEEVHLAHPLKVKAIAEAKIKTDKIDAKVLAHLLRADLLPEAYVASPEARKVRSVLRQRMFLVRVRTMIKNRIYGILDKYPEIREKKPCKELFGKKSLGWIKEAGFKETDREMIREDIKLLDVLSKHIEGSEKLVEKVSGNDWRVKLLKTIPGIGKFFAVLIAYEIDDIGRFRNEKKFYSYIGIIPSTYSSGGRTFHGRITKQGNKYLRWAMIEAVWPAIRKDRELRAYYERIKEKKGANPAKVATARRIATIVYRVLSRKREYKIFGSRLPSYYLGGPQ
jgi:transposase